MLLYAFLIRIYFAVLYFVWNKLEQMYEFWGLCSREISRMAGNLSQYNRWMEMPQISSRASQSPQRPTHPHRVPKLCLLPYVYLTKYILPYCSLHEIGSCRCMTRDTYTYRFFEQFFFMRYWFTAMCYWQILHICLHTQRHPLLNHSYWPNNVFRS